MKIPSTQIQNLYIEATDTDHSPSNTFEEEFQIDEITTTSATSDTSTNSKQINVLTQDQEFILEAIKRLDDPLLQKTYLDKLLKDFNQPEHPSSNPPNRSILPSTSTNTYDLTKIFFFFCKLTYVLKEEDTNIIRGYNVNHNHHSRITF